jgi:hypothetical protein
MSVFDPKQDAAVLKPLIEDALSKAIAQLTTETVPALQQALESVLDGLTVTITISRKGTS